MIEALSRIELQTIIIACSFFILGYGHYELTISSSEGTKTIVTGNMDLIERLNSEIDKEKEEATAEAIALVLESSL